MKMVEPTFARLGQSGLPLLQLVRSGTARLEKLWHEVVPATPFFTQTIIDKVSSTAPKAPRGHCEPVRSLIRYLCMPLLPAVLTAACGNSLMRWASCNALFKFVLSFEWHTAF
jgi:hypothetical protein